MDMTFSFRCTAVTHIGNRRRNNEDNFFIEGGALLSSDEQQSMSQIECRSIKKSSSFDGTANRIYAVSDGMGGHRDGEIASRIVVEALASLSSQHQAKASFKRQEKFEFIQLFQEMIAQTNAEILNLSGDFDPSGMGATLTGVLFFTEEAVSFNIGDSSTFLYENGSIQKLTIDDNEAELFKANGTTSADSSGKRLTKYFGMPRSCGILTARISSPIPLRSGQIYLIASDGLTDYLSLDEMAQAIKRNDCNPDSIASQLIENVLNLENGGHDNITAVVVKVYKTLGER